MTKGGYILLTVRRPVCEPQESGGLGISMVRKFNKALLAKLTWQMTMNYNKLGAQVMQEKYVKVESFLSAPVPSNASWGWKSIA